MRWDLVQAFLDALARLESANELDPMLRLFHADAQLENPHLGPVQGSDAVRRFWMSYRGAFDSVRSEFRRIVREGDTCVLEWASEGRGPAGDALRYQGVSILEFEGNRIRRFSAYFDPSALEMLAEGARTPADSAAQPQMSG